MTTQESEVDVLAVMDRLNGLVAEEWTGIGDRDLTGDDTIAKGERARAAVAEVFEAAIPFAVVAGGFDMADVIRLRTALRNAGGGEGMSEMKNYEAVIEIGFGARVINIQAKDYGEACDKAHKYAATFYNSRMTRIREVPAATLTQGA